MIDEYILDESFAVCVVFGVLLGLFVPLGLIALILFGAVRVQSVVVGGSHEH